MKILIVAHTSFNNIGGHERYTHQLANALAGILGHNNVLLWPVEQRIPLKNITGKSYKIISPRWYRNELARKIFHRYLYLIGIDYIISDTVHLAPKCNVRKVVG